MTDKTEKQAPPSADQAPTPTNDPKQGAHWLSAWYDPVANVKALSSCIGLADINGDGEGKLIIADSDRKLRIWKGNLLMMKLNVKGTSLIFEQMLLDIPVAMCTYYMDETNPRTAVIAIASGSNIFIYRNLKPYIKFNLPPVPIDPSELEIWQKLQDNSMSPEKAFEQLASAREKGIKLTTRSIDLLSIEQPDSRNEFIEQNKSTPVTNQTVITCMTTLKKSREEDNAVSCLVIGTESGSVFILEPNAQVIMKKFQIGNTAVFMIASGTFDVDYRIIIAARNRVLYTIKTGELSGVKIELEHQPIGLERINNIVVGLMNGTIHTYQLRGKKSYSIYLPCKITDMTALNHEATGTKCLVVALENLEVRLYNEKHLISTFSTPDIITGMNFGSFGRETSTLITILGSGAISCKILARSSSLTPSNNKIVPPEQDIPLKVPKKTKLYIEQAQREREQATEMHRIFQRELYKLRLATARAYVRVITDTQSPLTFTHGTSIRLSVKVAGVGPLFKLKVALENTGKRVIADIPITFTYNDTLYKMNQNVFKAPLLIPGLSYLFEPTVQALVDNGVADSIKIVVCSPNVSSVIPLINYVVQMPSAQPFLD